MIRINSWKQSVKSGLLNGIITSVLLTIFVCFVHYVLLGQEEFIGKAETLDHIGIFSFKVIQIVGALLSACVPIFLLRYSKFKFLYLYAFLSSALYVLLYIFLLFFGEIISFGFLYPMENFDTIVYACVSFPIGSVIGTIISIIINSMNNKKQQRESK